MFYLHIPARKKVGVKVIANVEHNLSGEGKFLQLYYIFCMSFEEIVHSITISIEEWIITYRSDWPTLNYPIAVNTTFIDLLKELCLLEISVCIGKGRASILRSFCLHSTSDAHILHDPWTSEKSQSRPLHSKRLMDGWQVTFKRASFIYLFLLQTKIVRNYGLIVF